MAVRKLMYYPIVIVLCWMGESSQSATHFLCNLLFAEHHPYLYRSLIQSFIHVHMIHISCVLVQLYIDITYELYYGTTNDDTTDVTPAWVLISANILICLQGTLTAIVFWRENKEIRLLWLRWFHEIFPPKEPEEDDLVSEDRSQRSVARSELLVSVDDGLRTYKQKWLESVRYSFCSVRCDWLHKHAHIQAHVYMIYICFMQWWPKKFEIYCNVPVW